MRFRNIYHCVESSKLKVWKSALKSIGMLSLYCRDIFFPTLHYSAARSQISPLFWRAKQFYFQFQSSKTICFTFPQWKYPSNCSRLTAPAFFETKSELLLGLKIENKQWWIFNLIYSKLHKRIEKVSFGTWSLLSGNVMRAFASL